MSVSMAHITTREHEAVSGQNSHWGPCPGAVHNWSVQFLTGCDVWESQPDLSFEASPSPRQHSGASNGGWWG